MQRIAGAAVRISVTGDTKTRKFRRTGNLPALWVEVLRAHRVAHLWPRLLSDWRSRSVTFSAIAAVGIRRRGA